MNEHEKCGHPPVFRYENVVGAAGRVAAHYLDAATQSREAPHDFRARQLVSGAGSDQENLGAEFRDVRQNSRIDIGQTMDVLAGLKAIREQDEGGVMSHVVDDEVPGPVCTYEVGGRVRIGRELHVRNGSVELLSLTAMIRTTDCSGEGG